MKNSQKNIITYSVLSAYSFLFLFSISNAFINSNPFFAFSVFIQLGSFLVAKDLAIGNLFILFFMLEFVLMFSLIYFLISKLINKTISDYEKYLIPLVVTLGYLFFSFFTISISDDCLGDICSLIPFPFVSIVNDAYLAIILNSAVLFIALFILSKIVESLTNSLTTIQANLKLCLPYIPTTIYIIAFSIIAISFPATGISPSFLSYINDGFGLFTFFEFIILSITIYVATKKIGRFSGNKENIILPVLITCGYLLWAIPIVIYSLVCDESFCDFFLFLPLSLTGYIAFIPIIGPFLGLIINGLISFYITKDLIYSKKIDKNN
ncbi:MAG: hypothetical protein WCX30_03870 [Candidatus Paceibacterota bacterium]|jgi:hypothetical protein|nr:hypothetical protein [bacterium]